MSTQDKYKILIIASLRYPIAEPFAGGLEAHTHALAHGLRKRGHSVLVAGAVGSDPDMVGYEFGGLPIGDPSERQDVTEHPVVQAAELRAFTSLMGHLHDGLLGAFDVIHNNTVHPFPVERAATLPCPLVTTLHTPQLPWAERVLGPGRQSAGGFVAVSRGRQSAGGFVAVSRATARHWQPLVRPRVVRNGVDTRVWRLGPGGDEAVWTGRIVPEKAPHLAIEIARAAGRELSIAGPVIDQQYFAAKIGPHLSDRIRYVGHLNRMELADLVGHSAVALVTPVWNEPFGMVAAEAMACGTPVVALARGGLPEIVDVQSGRLVPPADGSGFSADQLDVAVRAVAEAVGLKRKAVRSRAMVKCGSSAMIRGYERVYRDAVVRWDWP